MQHNFAYWKEYYTTNYAFEFAYIGSLGLFLNLIKKWLWTFLLQDDKWVKTSLQGTYLTCCTQHTRSLLPGLSLQSLSCVWQKGGCGRRESRSQKGSLVYRGESVLLVTLARTERDGLELLKPLLLYLGPSCQSLSRVNYRVRSHKH